MLKGLGINELPPALGRTSQLLADAAIPMMLVLLGLQLGGIAKLNRLPLVLTGTTIRLLLAPLIAIPLASVFGLTGAALCLHLASGHAHGSNDDRLGARI